MWGPYTNTINHQKFTIIRHESHNISKSRSYVENHIINERAAHAIYSLSSLAHDSVTMTLESRSMQSLVFIFFLVLLTDGVIWRLASIEKTLYVFASCAKYDEQP